jgi:hypothetical protein
MLRAMRSRLLARLAAAPVAIGEVAGAGALAVACADGVCVVVRPPAVPWRAGVLEGPIAGAGGWDERAVFVSERGEALEVDLGARAASRRALGPCRRWVAAARAAVSARVVPAGGRLDALYRSDELEVWDGVAERLRLRASPPARDCFEIDAVALAPDGGRVACTGLDIYYTSVGDWGWGQEERLFVYDTAPGGEPSPVLRASLGTTWSPSEHAAWPVALDGDACLVGAARVALPARAADLDEAELEPARDVVALAHGHRALTPEPGARVVVFDAHDREVGALEPGPSVSALGALDGELVVGCRDGSLLLLLLP